MQVHSQVSDETILRAISWCGVIIAIVGVLIGVVANTIA